jgi:hypothetical protein
MNKKFLALFATVALMSSVSSSPVFAVDWVNNATKKVQSANDGAHETVTGKVEAVDNKMKAMLGHKDQKVAEATETTEVVAVETVENAGNVALHSEAIETSQVLATDEIVDQTVGEPVAVVEGSVEKAMDKTADRASEKSLEEVTSEKSAVIENTIETTGAVSETLVMETTEEPKEAVTVMTEVSDNVAVETLQTPTGTVPAQNKEITQQVAEKATNAIDNTAAKAKNLFKGM